MHPFSVGSLALCDIFSHRENGELTDKNISHIPKSYIRHLVFASWAACNNFFAQRRQYNQITHFLDITSIQQIEQRA